jgi:hypothetical protein
MWAALGQGCRHKPRTTPASQHAAVAWRARSAHRLGGICCACTVCTRIVGAGMPPASSTSCPDDFARRSGNGSGALLYAGGVCMLEYVSVCKASDMSAMSRQTLVVNVLRCAACCTGCAARCNSCRQNLRAFDHSPLTLARLAPVQRVSVLDTLMGGLCDHHDARVARSSATLRPSASGAESR